MIAAVMPMEGSDILDVACGTGVLTRDARVHAGSSARVVGLDPAPGMLAVAQEIEPKIDWVRGVAEEIPFSAETFDIVFSQFGMMFFPDREKAISQIHRVLKPGGRLALAIWNSVDQNPAYKDIASILDDAVSTAAGDAVRTPFCMGAPEQVADLLAAAKFADIHYDTFREQARFPSSRAVVEAELRGWLPLFGIELSEEKIADVLRASDAPLAKFVSGSGEAVFQTSAYIMTARKPL